MAGWVYLIRNKDLHKIGRTENLEQRMKTLKPDAIVSTLETDDFESLEKELHKRYKDVRIPQSEWFRLTEAQLKDCTERLSGNFEERRNGLLAIAAVVLVSLIGGIIWYIKTLPEDQLFEALWVGGIGATFSLAGSIAYFGASGRKKGKDKCTGVVFFLIGIGLILLGLLQLLPLPV